MAKSPRVSPRPAPLSDVSPSQIRFRSKSPQVEFGSGCVALLPVKDCVHDNEQFGEAIIVSSRTAKKRGQIDQAGEPKLDLADTHGLVAFLGLCRRGVGTEELVLARLRRLNEFVDGADLPREAGEVLLDVLEGLFARDFDEGLTPQSRAFPEVLTKGADDELTDISFALLVRYVERFGVPPVSFALVMCDVVASHVPRPRCIAQAWIGDFVRAQPGARDAIVGRMLAISRRVSGWAVLGVAEILRKIAPHDCIVWRELLLPLLSDPVFSVVGDDVLPWLLNEAKGNFVLRDSVVARLVRCFPWGDLGKQRMFLRGIGELVRPGHVTRPMVGILAMALLDSTVVYDAGAVVGGRQFRIATTGAPDALLMPIAQAALASRVSRELRKYLYGWRPRLLSLAEGGCRGEDARETWQSICGDEIEPIGVLPPEVGRWIV